MASSPVDYSLKLAATKILSGQFHVAIPLQTRANARCYRHSQLLVRSSLLCTSIRPKPMYTAALPLARQ